MCKLWGKSTQAIKLRAGILGRRRQRAGKHWRWEPFSFIKWSWNLDQQLITTPLNAHLNEGLINPNGDLINCWSFPFRFRFRKKSFVFTFDWKQVRICYFKVTSWIRLASIYSFIEERAYFIFHKNPAKWSVPRNSHEMRKGVDEFKQIASL